MNIIFFPLIWAWQIALKIPTALLGLGMVAVAHRYRDTPLQELPFWIKPWANPEDWLGGVRNYKGSLPEWWIRREGGDGFKEFWWYHAIRNPADGLRNYPALQCWIYPEKIHYKTNEYQRYYAPWYIGKPGFWWHITWQGWWLGFELLWIHDEELHTNIKFGMKLVPSDAHDFDPSTARGQLGASFASKVKIKRPY